jgi:hypothetical protein
MNSCQPGSAPRCRAVTPRPCETRPRACAASTSVPVATADRDRTPPEPCSFPWPTLAPQCIKAHVPRASPSPPVRALCTRRTTGPSVVQSVRAQAEERRSTAASRCRRHGHASQVYLSIAARLCRAALAVHRHGCHGRLGELLPASSTKLRTHAHPLLVTCNIYPCYTLRHLCRRLTGSQAAAAGAAQHCRPSPPAPLRSLLRPRLCRR